MNSVFAIAFKFISRRTWKRTRKHKHPPLALTHIRTYSMHCTFTIIHLFHYCPFFSARYWICIRYDEISTHFSTETQKLALVFFSFIFSKYKYRHTAIVAVILSWCDCLPACLPSIWLLYTFHIMSLQLKWTVAKLFISFHYSYFICFQFPHSFPEKLSYFKRFSLLCIAFINILLVSWHRKICHFIHYIRSRW